MLPVIGCTHDHAAANDWINDWTMTDFGPHKKSMTGISRNRRLSLCLVIHICCCYQSHRTPIINSDHNFQQQANNKSFEVDTQHRHQNLCDAIAGGPIQLEFSVCPRASSSLPQSSAAVAQKVSPRAQNGNLREGAKNVCRQDFP